MGWARKAGGRRWAQALVGGMQKCSKSWEREAKAVMRIVKAALL